jgi:hypothetical protein
MAVMEVSSGALACVCMLYIHPLQAAVGRARQGVAGVPMRPVLIPSRGSSSREAMLAFLKGNFGGEERVPSPRHWALHHPPSLPLFQAVRQRRIEGPLQEPLLRSLDRFIRCSL